MRICVYKEKWMVPLKCGTRYIESVFDIPHTYLMLDAKEKLHIDSYKLFDLPNDFSITHLVIREPLSMLEAAIHTDILNERKDKIEDIDEYIKSPYVNKTLNDYTNIGTVHWSPHIWGNLYSFLKNYKNIKIVSIDNLSRFVYEETGIKKYSFPSNYNFQYFTKMKINYSREHIINLIKQTYPTLWNKIIELYEIDKVWYDKIMNGEYLEKINTTTKLI